MDQTRRDNFNSNRDAPGSAEPTASVSRTTSVHDPRAVIGGSTYNALLDELERRDAAAKRLSAIRIELGEINASLADVRDAWEAKLPPLEQAMNAARNAYTLAAEKYEAARIAVYSACAPLTGRRDELMRQVNHEFLKVLAPE